MCEVSHIEHGIARHNGLAVEFGHQRVHGTAEIREELQYLIGLIESET
jgi:hypothetical protein